MTDSFSFDRPADTTAYAIADVVSDSTSTPALITFENFQTGSNFITRAYLITNKSTITPRFRLHLFHTQPDPINDNSPFTLLYADKDKYIGYIDIPAMSTAG